MSKYALYYFESGATCPFCNTARDDKWNAMYQLLVDYKGEFGNTNIAKRDTYKNQNLGIWCQHQRNNYVKNQLSDDQIQKLQNIGFIFNPLDAEWERRYEQYERYIEKTGKTYISRRTDFENEHLGAWVETQRKWYAAGKMPIERAEKLLKINPEIFTK